MSADGDGRGKRGGKYEARSVGADSVDKVCRASDVTAYNAVCFAEGTSDNVDAVHDGTLDGLTTLTRVEVSLKIEMLGYPRAAGSVHADSMNLEYKVNRVRNYRNIMHVPRQGRL